MIELLCCVFGWHCGHWEWRRRNRVTCFLWWGYPCRIYPRRLIPQNMHDWHTRGLCKSREGNLIHDLGEKNLSLVPTIQHPSGLKKSRDWRPILEGNLKSRILESWDIFLGLKLLYLIKELLHWIYLKKQENWEENRLIPLLNKTMDCILESGELLHDQIEYQTLAGRLIYLIITRPVISYVVVSVLRLVYACTTN